MNKLLLFLSLALFFIYEGGVRADGTFITLSGGSPSTSSYSVSSAQSKIRQCSGGLVEVFNQTSAILGIGFGTASVAPSGDYKYVPPGPASGQRFKYPLTSGTYVYIRTPAGALTTGSFQVACTPKED